MFVDEGLGLTAEIVDPEGNIAVVREPMSEQTLEERLAEMWEDEVPHQTAMRSQGPNLTYLTFQDGVRNAGTHWITDAPEFSDTFSWFIPATKTGDHDMKFGFQAYYVRWHYQNNAQLNGTFVIPSNTSFNAAIPSTYPERLTIQAPTDQYITMTQFAYTGFIQDKWHVSNRATFNLGLRYDIDFTPLDESGNSAFSDPTAYPVDKNNLSPRVGFTYSMNEGKSLIRTGWGLFYDKTNFGQLNSYVVAGTTVPSVTVQFPADNIDPGPRAGKLPTNPMLVNGPVVNYGLLNSLYPAGSLQRNTGDVFLDSPNRQQPYTQQISAGYQRQLGPALSASADYVHTMARDQWLLENLNPGLRVNTTASGAIVRVDPTYVTNVWQRQNIGEYTYDALNVVLEKRDSHNWSGRVSYTLANSRGNNSGALTSTNNYQVLNDPNLALGQGPTDFDRRHNLVLSGRISDVPRTHGMTLSATMRMLSGTAFSLIDTSSDPDRNGILADPLPAGTYSGNGANAITVENVGGRNGAFGPGYAQLDTRIGWRFRVGGAKTLDLNMDPGQYLHGLLNMPGGMVSLAGAPIVNTFARVASELKAGVTNVELDRDVSDWAVGSKLIIPDSSQIWADWNSKVTTPIHWEENSVANVMGKTVTLASPLAFEHPGARDGNGRIDLLHEPFLVAGPRKVVGPWQLHIPSPGDVLGYVTRSRHVLNGVVDAMQDEGGDVDRGKDLSDVRVAADRLERLPREQARSRALRRAFELPGPEGGDGGHSETHPLQRARDVGRALGAVNRQSAHVMIADREEVRHAAVVNQPFDQRIEAHRPLVAVPV
jgi:hypothetical protein